jgi:HD-GYP domain-containing protein (c-di-GMP phosphodiesterase class II)
LSSRNRVFTGLAALGVLGILLYQALSAHQGVFWLSVAFLGVLAVICESLGSGLETRGRSTYVIMVLAASLLALNTLSAVLVALLASLSLQDLQSKRSPWAMAFNGLQYALGTAAACYIYHALGGAARFFELGKTLRSIPYLLLALVAFWAVNALMTSLANLWEYGLPPLQYLRRDALRMLPNQLFYGLLGMALGIIYAQNAFHLGYIRADTGELVEKLADVKSAPADYLGPYVLGTAGEALRGFAASLLYLSLLGVAWYFSGRNLELLRAYDSATERLVSYLETREPYLQGHAGRVAYYSQLLALKLGMSSYDRRKLRYTALLHDLGKAVVPREILLQKGALSEEEFRRVQQHALAGSNWLEEIPYLADAAGAVLHHHEYFDGGGYPDGISGDTIPLVARVIAVADAYDAMLNPRPWREAKTPEAAAAELQQNAGVQFDPELVKLFLGTLQEYGGEPVEEDGGGEPPEEGSWQPEERERPRRERRPGRRRQQALEERRKRREQAMRSEVVADLMEEGPREEATPEAPEAPETPGAQGRQETPPRDAGGPGSVGGTSIPPGGEEG